MSEPLHIKLHPGINPPNFNCKVISSEIIDGSPWVQFDESYYYPSGGGQPADHGIISSDGTKYSILDVKKRTEMLHQLDDSVDIDSLMNKSFTAEIDQQRRAILCRMHTAQHLISAAADELFGATTVGNQINIDKTRIDIGIESRESFSKDDLESSVNNFIDSEVDVSMSFRPRNQLIEDPLVRVNMNLIPKHINQLRVITIEGIDICPCAGTHVGNTGDIGHIQIGKVKSKGAGKLRVEYTLIE